MVNVGGRKLTEDVLTASRQKVTLTFTQVQLPIGGKSIVEVLDASQPERRLICMAVRKVKVDLSKLPVTRVEEISGTALDALLSTRLMGSR